MENTENRNEKIKVFLETLYQKAVNRDFQPDETQYKETIDKLFETTVWGFREMLLVVVVGMALDSSFRASTELYNCNPRAIFEGPIKDFLIQKNIPHRKSGPLNVAKATVGLDMTWAAKRKPFYVAEALVNLVDFLESADNPALTIENVGVSLLRRLIAQAQYLAELVVDINPSEDTNYLYELCRELIIKTPDAGNTPQKIVALLLICYHSNFYTGVNVTGSDDRASVTSTTSKKPGDINEERDGKIFKVYEVTVKPFNLARIRDSFDCISIYNKNSVSNIHEITVICRREDCPSGMVNSGLHTYLGRYDYQGMVYYFLEIYEWIAIILQHMTPEGRNDFYVHLNDYINDINTAESVKQLWRALHM